MKLVKVNPAYSFNAVDRLLNDFFQEGLKNDRYAKNEIKVQPATNIFDYNEFVKIEMQIPGFSKEQVKITLDNDVLIVKGEMAKEEKEEVNYSRVEFKVSDFEKKFKLNHELDAEKVQANFSNGILILTIAKKEEQKPVVKNIEIA
ncbi:Hsp20/alpha crystallin family protein [Mangrovibacterium diazotrophicum]|uniref:HSP20 family protein n=1 Tax=Mangrovibacterium diazotrophicum TaxID=1261403 RepID=A0A419VWX0_9BACT|nr:Hsp20/alpha crystallin family protein [Mangrovibacterium diazotrophicum]RKD86492.1 HSP20 family protein [Mangrovibacterium diazotrophicum]